VVGLDAAVNALLMLAALGTACGCGFVAFLVGTLLWHRKRWVSGALLVGAGLCLVIAPIVFLASRRPSTPESYELAVNLAQPTNLNWVPEEVRWLKRADRGRFFAISGKIALQLALPDGLIFQARANRLGVETSGRAIEHFEFGLAGGMSQSDAVDFALREAGWWGESSTGSIDLSELVDWIRAGRDPIEGNKAFTAERELYDVELEFARGSSTDGPSYAVSYRVRLKPARGRELNAGRDEEPESYAASLPSTRSGQELARTGS
jgi:hypothetical protein